MITLIHGENAYERDQQVAQVLAGAEAVERYDGAEVTPADIRQFLQGVSLFAADRLVVISNLSDNKPVWIALGEQLEKVDAATVSLLLNEPKPDKRTKTYKTLQKIATVTECKPFGERDQAKAQAWLQQYAKAQKISLDTAGARELVRRVGVEQYTLLNELQRLAVMGDITLQTVQTYTEESPHDTAFDLLAFAIDGKTSAVQQKIRTLQASEDAYMTLGLLISQAYTLAGHVLGGNAADASDLGVHPFAFRQAKSTANSLSEVRLQFVVAELASVDMQLKSTSVDPWLAIEVALTTIAESAQ